MVIINTPDIIGRDEMRRRKDNPNLLKKISSVIAICFFLSGCGSDWILRADFVEFPETNILELAGDIPDLPEGDRILVDSDCEQAKVKSGKLRFQNCPLPGIRFRVAPHDPPSEYRILWRGSREIYSNFEHTMIYFDCSGNCIVFNFADGKLEIRSSGVNVEPIDIQDNTSHEIEVWIKTGISATVDVIYRETGESVIKRSFNLNTFFVLKYISFSTSSEPYFLRYLAAVAVK